MTVPQPDIAGEFIEAYVKGHFLQAWQSIVCHPEIAYDALSSRETILPHLINYADASIFKAHPIAVKINHMLQMALESDRVLFHTYTEFSALLKLEYNLLSDGHFGTSPLMIHRALFQKNWSAYQHIQSNSAKLAEAKPALSIQLKQALDSQPLYAFAYPKKAFKPSLPEAAVPFILLAPIQDVDYADILKPYEGRPKILAFESLALLWQHLQFDSLLPLLCEPQSMIYLMELHPACQFAAASQKWPEGEKLSPIALTENKAFYEAFPYLQEALIKNQQDRLYLTAQRMLTRIQVLRYGKSRCFALNRLKAIENWHDPHKPQLPPDVDIGPIPVDYVQQALLEYKEKQKKRVFLSTPRIRVAHVIAQIVDPDHAPSRLLRMLLKHSNHTLFENVVICTECFVPFDLEYPFIYHFSASSAMRGKNTIVAWEKSGINVFILAPALTYEGSALLTNKILTQLNVDVAIYHGPDQINAISSSSCDVPVCVLFDHGTMHAYPGFDIAILSNHEALKAHKPAMDRQKIKGFVLPFCIDVREQWAPSPHGREEIGLPQDAFIMTTISNHLNNRLSDEMCHAIGKILQRCPNAFYAPMGNMEDPERFQQIFATYGVADRVRFLGAINVPSQCARAMNLYLNEFPFGSGIGILEAMAAGCPVVSMYDEQGPSQAVYGGVYFGKDRVIANGKASDYIDLACRLVEDKKMYQEWSDHALKQYEKHANVKEYVREFEKIIKNSL